MKSWKICVNYGGGGSLAYRFYFPPHPQPGSLILFTVIILEFFLWYN